MDLDQVREELRKENEMPPDRKAPSINNIETESDELKFTMQKHRKTAKFGGAGPKDDPEPR